MDMARWEWQGGDWRVGRGCQAGRCWGQREADWVEEAGGEGKTAGVLGGWSREKLSEEEAVDGKVKKVRYR